MIEIPQTTMEILDNLEYYEDEQNFVYPISDDNYKYRNIFSF